MAEAALVACPTTGQSVERVMQPFTPRYKGTGFYSTDHRTSQPPEPAAQRPMSASAKNVEARGMTDRAP